MTRLNAKNGDVHALRAVGAGLPMVDVDAACLDAFQAELDYIHATLRRLGTPLADVDDLAQEVFLALRRAWLRCDHSRPLRPYIFGIAFKIASSHRRKHRREVPFGGVDAAMDEATDLDAALQSKQARSLVLAALNRVPLRRRAVLVMHDLDDVSVGEIASVLGIQLFTVYARLRKGRRELASALRRMLSLTRDELLMRELPARVRGSGRA